MICCEWRFGSGRLFLNNKELANPGNYLDKLFVVREGYDYYYDHRGCYFGNILAIIFNKKFPNNFMKMIVEHYERLQP